MFGWILLTVAGIITSFYLMDPGVMQTASLWFSGVLMILPIPLWISRYIDYKMDFLVITPRDATLYIQLGLFKKTVRTVDLDKVKTVSIKKHGPLRSIFNYGSILFLSEGDEETGEIHLTYVSRPEKVKAQISQIVYSL